jgi:hypothetical protein
VTVVVLCSLVGVSYFCAFLDRADKKNYGSFAMNLLLARSLVNRAINKLAR